MSNKSWPNLFTRLDICICIKPYGLHGICDDVVHLQHDQSYMGCRQMAVSYWMESLKN